MSQGFLNHDMFLIQAYMAFQEDTGDLHSPGAVQANKFIDQGWDTEASPYIGDCVPVEPSSYSNLPSVRTVSPHQSHDFVVGRAARIAKYSQQEPLYFSQNPRFLPTNMESTQGELLLASPNLTGPVNESPWFEDVLDSSASSATSPGVFLFPSEGLGLGGFEMYNPNLEELVASDSDSQRETSYGANDQAPLLPVDDVNLPVIQQDWSDIQGSQWQRQGLFSSPTPSTNPLQQSFSSHETFTDPTPDGYPKLMAPTDYDHSNFIKEMFAPNGAQDFREGVIGSESSRFAGPTSSPQSVPESPHRHGRSQNFKGHSSSRARVIRAIHSKPQVQAPDWLPKNEVLEKIAIDYADKRELKTKFPSQDKREGIQHHVGEQRRREIGDEFLLRAKKNGMSYKEIRQKGNFWEKESTLRGRYRALTKEKDSRVRKPEWTKSDVSVLQCEHQESFC